MRTANNHDDDLQDALRADKQKRWFEEWMKDWATNNGSPDPDKAQKDLEEFVKKRAGKGIFDP